MEEENSVDIKTEVTNDVNASLAENEPKQEQDFPEFINVNSFSDLKFTTDVRDVIKEWYRCNQCRNKYKKEEYLTIHRAVHDPQRSCPVCCEKFTSKKKFGFHLNQHIKDRMKEERKDICKVVQEWYQCNQCSSRYKKAACLTIHIAVHDPERTCPVCFEKFTCKKKFGFHLNQHIKDRIKEEEKVMYKCGDCKKTFNNRKSIVLHTRVHTNERPHKCEICGEGFKQAGALKDHYVTHTKERLFVCEVCNGSFTTSSSLKRHKRGLHDKGKTINCKFCNAKFLNMADFKAHMSDVHPEAGFKRICPVCSEVFYSKMLYRKHKQAHDEQLLGVKRSSSCYVCVLCGEKNNTLDSYFKHTNSHINYTENELEEATKKNSFSCKVCAKEIKTKHTLFRHMDTHMEKKFRCKLCETFYTYFGLRVHMKTLHQILRCQVCYKELPGRRCLNNHYKKQHPTLKKHKQFNCSICGRQYMQKHALAAHYKLIHEKNGVKNFKCSVCGLRFLTSLILAAHRSHHKESAKSTPNILNHEGGRISKSQNEQPRNKNNLFKSSRKCFQCKVCKKVFRSSMNYKNHVARRACISFLENIKTDVKCSVCDKTLACRDTLRGHMELHSSSQYKCRFCNKSYKQFVMVRRHLRMAHPGEPAFWCDACSEGFNNVYYFKKHVNMHKMKLKGLMDFEDCTDKVLGVSCGYVKEEVDAEVSNEATAT